MHPRIEELLAHLDRTRAELQDALESVPAEHRDRVPGDGRWSVAGILDHLGMVERSITRLLEKRAADGVAAGTLGPETDIASTMGGYDERMLRDRTQRITAPERIHPR